LEFETTNLELLVARPFPGSWFLTLGSELFSELAFEDFAGGVAGKVFNEEDVFGTLEVRQVCAGVLLQVLAQVLRFGAVFGHHHGAYGFDPLFVGKVL
jgi:hypothetical protein